MNNKKGVRYERENHVLIINWKSSKQDVTYHKCDRLCEKVQIRGIVNVW